MMRREFEAPRSAINCARGTAAITALLCSTAIAIGQQPVTAAIELAQQFANKPKADQARIADAVRTASAAFDGSYFETMQAVIRSGANRTAAKPAKTRVRRPKKRAPKPNKPSAWEMPFTVRYVYGRATIEPLKGNRTALESANRRVPVELALLGMLPDSDRALAEIELGLDGDRRADRFAAFLETWRNGDESFYQALDRTAGTDDSVFFYDAMLGDFVSEFADPKDKATAQLKQSLDAAHDALHSAFLSYRQYRAFREAVALSMLLPPDVPLPERLERYERKVAGAYSLRQQVMMVLAVHDYDAMAVVQQIMATCDLLPKHLWQRRYDPYPGWNKVFAAEMPKMIQAAGNTDAFLQRVVELRQQQANKIRQLAQASLAGNAGPKR